MKKTLSLLVLLAVAVSSANGGIMIVRSSGIALTGADGISYVGITGLSAAGPDAFMNYRANGITLTGADGLPITGADGLAPTLGNGATYVGPNGITLTGADGIALTGADGITLTGADGITLTGADGTQYRADSIVARRPNGIALTGADGIALTGVDGITLTGADGAARYGTTGIALTGADTIAAVSADGIALTGADGIALTGADSITGFNSNGVVFELANPAGIALTGADGITLTGADGITLTGADGVKMVGIDGIALTGADDQNGIQSVDPDLAVQLNNATDDSNINAIVVFHRQVTNADIQDLRSFGITGGTRLRALPMVYVTATRAQLVAVSSLPNVRSLYGNRTLNFNSDPYFSPTGVARVPGDAELRNRNASLPVSGRNVTVAVLDTGINSLHSDLAGKVVQNVRLSDVQSAPGVFAEPAPLENVANTDVAAGHGTFVAGIIAGSGARSNGKFAGVAPGSKLLGLSAGDINLTHVLAGFDYLLDKGPQYNVKVVNCSFSSAAVFDVNDPVNIATKLLTDRGVNVVFSAGNTGSSNGTMNPYASAPWVIGVGASDNDGKLATYSSRGTFGDEVQHPSLIAPGTKVASLRSTPTTTGISGLGGADTERLSLTELPYYTTASGTSFSAPQVAGAIALMLEMNPTLRPSDIKDILSRTATPMPRYFYHEVGAGMLNTYSAVLQAAFPERIMGVFRSANSGNSVKFVTSVTERLDLTAYPGAPAVADIAIPANTVQANISIAWGLSTNDFGLKVFTSGGEMVAESNVLNLPGVYGRTERAALRSPSGQTYRAEVRHTADVGTPQQISGVVETTRVEYPDLVDLSTMSPQSLADAKNSLLMSVMLPEGHKFRPDTTVRRVDFAEAIVRSGRVPQYVAGSPLFTDVRDFYSRNSVESVQSNPDGRLIFDAPLGSQFYPNANTTKLIAAVALVKAARLDAAASTAALPSTISDIAAIPVAWRGYVAVALQNRFVRLDGVQFNPTRPVTRIEVAAALNRLVDGN